METTRSCDQCGDDFIGKTSWARFCSLRCRNAWWRHQYKLIGPSGPKGTALHQTIAVIAPPSGGKQSGIDVTKECLLEAEAAHLIGPNRFKSGSALVRWVKEHPVSLCVQDEFGCF